MSNTRLDEVVESLPDVDVLSLIETSTSWSDIFPSLEKRWPSQWIDLRDNPFGICLLTRAPVRSSEWIMLTPGGYPALRTDLVIDGVEVTILTVHTMSPQSLQMLATRDAQFRMLSDLIRAIPGNLILMGDLNASSRRSSSLLDLMAEIGLRRNVIHGMWSGVTSGTWPASLPSMIRLPIDHCLVRGDITPISTRTFPIPGADHLGLEVELLVHDGSPEDLAQPNGRHRSMSPWGWFWRATSEHRQGGD